MDQSCRSTTIICYLKKDQFEFLEARRLKCLVNEFAALTNSEYVSWYTGDEHNECVPNNVWNGLKHVRTHEYVDQSLVDGVD